MDINKEREVFQKFCEENFDFERHEQTYFDEQTQSYENDLGECTESINMAWSAWQAKAQAVPDLSELQERIAGHQYYHDEHGHMIVDMDDVVKEISGFDSWKAQAVPEKTVQLHLVWNQNKDECVGFLDSKDARYTATRDYRGMFGVTALGDYFRDLNDERDEFETQILMIEAQEPAND